MKGGCRVDIRLLRTFVTAARLGSLTQAAERLFLAQPTVTVHITRLEERLGCPLFHRSRTGVALTPAGRRFLPYATRILEAHDAGIEDLNSFSQGYSRRLTIIASPMVAATALPPLLRQFTAAHPDVELSIDVRQSVEIGEALASGQGDLGLSLMVPAERSLEALALYDDPVLLVAPHDGRDWDREPADPEELLERCPLFTHSHPVFWDDLLLALRQAGLRLRTVRVSEMHVTKRLVEEGLGVSFLPESAVWRELVEGRIMEVPTPRLPLPRATTYLVLPREAGLSPEAAGFRELLQRTFQPEV